MANKKEKPSNYKKYKEYWQTESGKESKKRYINSDLGKEALRRYRRKRYASDPEFRAKEIARSTANWYKKKELKTQIQNMTPQQKKEYDLYVAKKLAEKKKKPKKIS